MKATFIFTIALVLIAAGCSNQPDVGDANRKMAPGTAVKAPTPGMGGAPPGKSGAPTPTSQEAK